MQKEIETLERAGIIERSISPWASPVVIVPKKSTPGEPPRRRMCIDYRKINKLQPEVTKADGGKGCISLIPLPKIDELYAKLKGYKVFSSLDLRSGYYHIGLKDSAKPKSAFVLSSLGKYQFNRVPFGIAQAPAYFQKLINDVLKGCSFAMGYLDDIIIYSRSEKEHLEHLEEIFTRLKTAGLKLKLEKCCFFKKHIQYLGHLISADGIQPLPEKLESIAKMPAPKNPKEVKQFLGLVGYYRKFVPRFADISRVLTHLTKKDVEFKWTPECKNCFQILKEFLQQAPILRYPDPQANYTLYTDASKYAYAGVLTQHYNGTDHPITYVSGLFRGSQLNWATLTKEAYAIYMSVKKLSFYIDTAKITVKSDHLPLKKFLEKNTLNSKVNNWAVELESQDITFEYIPGIRNTLADTLSRLIEMDENIQLQPEEEGKEFGYFPFEELPPVTTQVLEEVIVCEIGNISIQHTDPVEINTDIQLPLKGDKLAKLQESDPHTRQLRKQWESKNLDQNTYMMENNILKQKLVDYCKKWTIVHTHSSSRRLKRLSSDPSTRQARPQWIQENLCIFKKQVPLEGHEESSIPTLHKLPSVCKTQHQNPTVKKRTLLITTPTNGIHSNGPNRRIPPSIQQGQQIRPDRSMHAHRIHILHPTEKQTCRRRNKSIYRPHMLYFRTIKKNPHRQRH